MSEDAKDSCRRQPGHFYGAAIIDAAGREVPITEEMIRRACEALDASWRVPASGRGRSSPTASGRD